MITTTNLITAIWLVFLIGCSAMQRAHVNASIQRGMDVTTDIVDPGYELAVISCDVAEGIAIQSGENAEETRSEIQSIRIECDRIFASFESVRVAQTTLRELGAAYQSGDADFAQLVSAFNSAKDLAGTVKSLVSTFRRQHNLGARQ